YLPKDLVVISWYHRVRKKSLAHFSGLGFRTMAGVYYDDEDLERTKDWLEDLKGVPGACGLIYCSWSNKYDLLGEFGDLVSPPRE
ncbi:MAG: hypothetical protein JXQ83_00965, partial [Candidatus Glassbacteria bacterium]|nr:hypothetical protein [Candidatus Glassbacteria bacterium]